MRQSRSANNRTEVSLSLPLTVAGGAPFVERNIILFLTFSVILTTLVVQGLSLGLSKALLAIVVWMYDVDLGIPIPNY